MSNGTCIWSIILYRGLHLLSYNLTTLDFVLISLECGCLMWSVVRPGIADSAGITSARIRPANMAKLAIST